MDHCASSEQEQLITLPNTMLFDASKYARFISHLLEIYISLLKKQKQINPSGPFSQRPEISDSTKKLVYCNISKSTVPHSNIAKCIFLIVSLLESKY